MGTKHSTVIGFLPVFTVFALLPIRTVTGNWYWLSNVRRIKWRGKFEYYDPLDPPS